MKKIKNFITCFLLLVATQLVGQQGTSDPKVFVSNTPSEDAVQIKWFTQNIYTTEAVNIYRRENNNDEWEKLNAAPINKQDRLLRRPPNKAEVLDTLLFLLKDEDPADVPGLTKLIVATQAISSEEFAESLGVFFTDRTAERGKRYVYRVAAIQNDGIEVDLGESEPIRAGNFQLTDPPKEIEVVKDVENDTLVNIKWLPEEGRYFAVNVYRTNRQTGIEEKITPNPVMPTKNPEGQYLDFFLHQPDHQEEQSYDYVFKAIDFFGREGKASRSFRVNIAAFTPPPPPKDLELMRNNGTEFFIFWNEPDTIDQVVGYNVHVGRSVEGPFEKVNKQPIPPNTTQSRFAVKEWGSYFVFVETVGQNDLTAATKVAGIDMLDVEPPAAPEKVEVKSDAGAITISWRANSEDDLLGYRVFRSIEGDPSKPYAMVTPEFLTEPNFTDRIPKVAQNRFFYKVAAVDTSFNLSELTVPVGAVMPDVTAPEKPFIKDIEANATAVTIRWLPNRENDLQGYRITRTDTPETPNWQPIGSTMIDKKLDQFTDEDVQGGTKYCYRLEAIDQVGNVSEPSDFYSARPWGASAGGGIDSFSASLDAATGAVKLQWTPSLSEGLDGAIIYRKEATANFKQVSPFVKEQNFADSSIEPGQTYSYRVKLFYSSGTMVESEEQEVIVARQ